MSLFDEFEEELGSEGTIFDEFEDELGLEKDDRGPELTAGDVGTAVKEGGKDTARSQLRGTGGLMQLPERVARWAAEGIARFAGEDESNIAVARESSREDVMTSAGKGLVELSKAESLKADEKFQERMNEFKGARRYVLDVARGAPQVAGQFALVAINPAVSGSAMFAQIYGGKLEEYEKQGIPESKAITSALFSAVTQTPLEYLGATKVVGKIGSRAKSKFVEWAKRVGEEGLTEWVQKYPDKFADVMAEHADDSTWEQVGKWVDQLGQTTVEGMYEGLVSLPLAGGGAGISVAFGEKKTEPPKTEDEAAKKAQRQIMGKDIDAAFGEVSEKDLAGKEQSVDIPRTEDYDLYFSRKGLGIGEAVPTEQLEAQRARDAGKRKQESAAEMARINMLKSGLPKEPEPESAFVQYDVADLAIELENEMEEGESREKAEKLYLANAEKLGETERKVTDNKAEDQAFINWERKAKARTYTEAEATAGRGIFEREADEREQREFAALAAGTVYASPTQVSSGMPQEAVKTVEAEKVEDAYQKAQSGAQLRQAQEQQVAKEQEAQAQAAQAQEQARQAQNDAISQENDRFIRAVSTPEGVMGETSRVLGQLEKSGDKGVSLVSKPIRAIHKALSTNEDNPKKLTALRYDLLEKLADAEQLDPKLSLIMTRLAKISDGRITDLNLQEAREQKAKEQAKSEKKHTEKKPEPQGEKVVSLDTITVRLNVPILDKDGKYVKHSDVSVSAAVALKENTEQQTVLERMLECLAG